MTRGSLAAAVLACGLLMTACSTTEEAGRNASAVTADPGAPGQAIQDLCLKIVADGMTEADANQAAAEAGFTTRVGSIDGEPLATTRDYRIDRMTFDIENGVVTGCVVG